MAAPSERADKQTSRRGGLIALAVLLVTVVAIAGGTYLLIRLTSNPAEGSTEPYREAWASAMRKAGVEATLPPSPTALTAYRGDGSHPFEATFTAEEATALLAVYPFAHRDGDTTAILSNPRLTFPKAGTMRIDTGIESSIRSGDLDIEGLVTFGPDDELRSPGADEVSFEGIPLAGVQASQATAIALQYGNAYLKAAPALTVDSAEVVDDGIRVRGLAPDRLVPTGAP